MVIDDKLHLNECNAVKYTDGNCNCVELLSDENERLKADYTKALRLALDARAISDEQVERIKELEERCKDLDVIIRTYKKMSCSDGLTDLLTVIRNVAKSDGEAKDE